MNKKFLNLKYDLSEMNKQGICLAFSGGVDSTLLLYLCKDLNVCAVTCVSDFQTKDEILRAKFICDKFSLRQIQLKINLFQYTNIICNPKNRCYTCKKIFFNKIKETAEKLNLKFVVDGTNYDDINKYRPGLKVLEELGIVSPFAKNMITKKEIVSYSKQIGLECFNLSSNSCLATRFPYGQKLSLELLDMVEQGEKILVNYGFEKNRLRVHENLARIEIENSKMLLFLKNKESIVNNLKQLGFQYITLDLESLRSGSMDI